MGPMAELVAEPASDPDAQAVITDFLDFTEYFPSDLLRSLTLIRGLDETYQSNVYAVHDLTRVYGSLPKYPASSRPNAQTLRSQIATHLDRALNARESSYAEAARMYDAADRHYHRLQSIITKLNALPKPPSRDPTPQATKSPQAKRSRSGRKIEPGTSIQRLTLNPPRGSTVASAILQRPRQRRITVPGEVLPAFDPDSPIASTEVSDWDEPPLTPVRPVLKLKTNPPKEKEVLKKTREPRETTTYRKPTPPPEDAEIGSKYKPWVRLTEWEMYKLRKKMKKNHSWEPSDIMIRRELAERGRGWDNYYRARAEAQARGRKLLDCDNLDRGPAKPDKPGTPNTANGTDRRDSRRSEPRAQKIETAARNQAQMIAAQEAELAARRLGDIGSAFKNLFSPLSSALGSLSRSKSSPLTNGAHTGKNRADKNLRKRKADEIETSASPSVDDTKQKKQKTSPKPSPLSTAETPTPAPTTIKIPLKLHVSAPSANPSTAHTPQSVSRAPSIRIASVAPKTESTPPVLSRPSSRRSTAEPAPSITFRGLARRTSTPVTRKTPVPETTPKTTITAASQRPKREAPGTVTQSSQDGGAAVSISIRKTKPAKKAAHAQKEADVPVPQIRIDVDGNQELVDPDEERYCICGDVSWGEMICCELDEKVRQPVIVPVMLLSFPNSASLDSGSIWSASSSTNFLHEQSSGIVLATERSTTRVNTRMDWWEGASSNEWVTEAT